MSLNRNAILAAQDLPREEVQVPEWGGSVWVSTMTGEGRDAFEQSIVAGQAQKDGPISNIRARLLCFTLVDAQGNRLFALKDVAALGEKSGLALDRCVKAAQRLNGIGGDALEVARGNSSGDRSAASTLSSPTDTASPSANFSGDSAAQS